VHELVLKMNVESMHGEKIKIMSACLVPSVWVTFLSINYLSITSPGCYGCTSLFEVGCIVTVSVISSLHRYKLSSCNFLAVYHFHIIH